MCVQYVRDEANELYRETNHKRYSILVVIHVIIYALRTHVYNVKICSTFHRRVKSAANNFLLHNVTYTYVPKHVYTRVFNVHDKLDLNPFDFHFVCFVDHIRRSIVFYTRIRMWLKNFYVNLYHEYAIQRFSVERLPKTCEKYANLVQHV